MPRLITFDFDDTLVNSQHMLESFWKAFCSELNIPEPCYDTLREGYANQEDYDFWPGHDFSREKQDEYLQEYWSWTFDINHPKFPKDVYPDYYKETEQTLEELKRRGYTLAIITARGQATLEYYLDHHNILDRFAAIRTRDDRYTRNEPIKPAPDQLLSVMSELGFTSGNTLMLGDHAHDMQMAKSAGVHAVGVSWGVHTHDRLESAGADFVIDDHLLNLLDVIDGLWPELHLSD